MKVNISYGLSRTLNMGDFESTKLHVGVSMEVEDKVSKDEVEKVYKRIKSFVDEKIEEEERKWKT